MDPLAEYNFRLSPYNYVENNPLRYIDPFGLDKEDREERRRQRQAGRRNKKIPENLRYELQQVTVTAKRKNVKHTNHVEEWQDDASAKGISFTTKQGGEQSNNRDSEVWLEIDSEFLEFLGLWMKRYNKQKFEFKEKSSGIEMATKSIEAVGTSDEKILKNNTGTTSEQTNPENSTIVKAYNGKGKYSRWKGKDGMEPGSKKYTDPSGDSTLIVRPNGDSLLFVPWPGGGGTRVSTTEKK